MTHTHTLAPLSVFVTHTHSLSRMHHASSGLGSESRFGQESFFLSASNCKTKCSARLLCVPSPVLLYLTHHCTDSSAPVLAASSLGSSLGLLSSMVACVYKMTTIHAHRVHVQVYASRLTQSAFPPVAARGEGGGAFGICLVEFGKKAEAASLQLRVFPPCDVDLLRVHLYTSFLQCTFF